MKVVLVMALSADGRIACHRDEFINWTPKEDKAFFVQETKSHGCVIMGSRTFNTFKKPLPGRLNIVCTRTPARYASKEIAPTFFEKEKNLIFTSASPQEILDFLASRGFTSAALIGGSTINTLFLKSGLIHELVFTFSPIILGSGLGPFEAEVRKPLKLLSLSTLSDNLFVARYRVLS